MFIHEDRYGSNFADYLVDMEAFNEEIDYQLKAYKKKPDYYTMCWLERAREALEFYIERRNVNDTYFIEAIMKSELIKQTLKQGG